MYPPLEKSTTRIAISSSNDEILINHQDLKNLAAEKDVLVSDKRRTNIGQRTKNHNKEKTKTKREKVGQKKRIQHWVHQNLYVIPNSYSKLSSTTNFEFIYRVFIF